MVVLIALYAVFKQFRMLAGILSSRPATRGLALMMIPILLGGMFFYRFSEDWSYLDSLYFCVITLTTIGYGDLAPDTDGGKIFTIVYAIIGLGITVVFLSEIGQGIMDARGKRLEGNAD